LPHGNATQLETEDVVAGITVERGTVTVLPELFWGKDVVLFAADGPAARMDVPFTVDTTGRYELSVQTTSWDSTTSKPAITPSRLSARAATRGPPGTASVSTTWCWRGPVPTRGREHEGSIRRRRRSWALRSFLKRI